MYDKFANKTAPRTPRCLICAQPMQLLRRTSRFGELPDLYSFYCGSVTSGTLKKATQLRIRFQTLAASLAWVRSGADQ